MPAYDDPAPGGADSRHVPRDSVDLLLASWAQRRPDLDFSPVALIARLARVRTHVDAALDRVFADHGLGAASFAVLVTLARVDDGGGVTQRRLMDELGLTSGTMSVRIDRMAEAGLVVRGADPDSKRNSLVSLTPAGRELADRVVPAHLDNEARLLAALDPGEQALLAGLLRTLLVEFEGSGPPGDAPCRLGLTLAPAHRTIAVRQSVGLPPVAGLLVRGAQPDGPAAAAGVRAGDVLLRAGVGEPGADGRDQGAARRDQGAEGRDQGAEARDQGAGSRDQGAGGRELRSVAALHAAVAAAGPGGRLRLRLARGADELTVTVALGEGDGAAGAVAAPAGRTATGHHRV